MSQARPQGLLKEFFTDGSCRCTDLAQVLNDSRETLLNLDNEDADTEAIAARQREREEDRLPPALKSS